MTTIDYKKMLDAAQASHEARVRKQHVVNEEVAAKAIAAIVDTAETQRRRIDAGFGDSSPEPAADGDDKEGDSGASKPTATPPKQPDPPPTSPVDEPAAAPIQSTTTTTRKRRWNVTDWSVLQKTIAIFGFIAGLIFGFMTVDWANSDWTGLGNAVVSILWVLICGLFVAWFTGFIAGLLMSDHEEVVDETTTTTTTTPAPASAS